MKTNKNNTTEIRTNNVTLRNKTINMLDFETAEHLTSFIASLLEKKNESYVKELIWKLTYNPIEAAIEAGFSEKLSSQQITTIRNEIASQYRQVHKDWKYGQSLDSKYKDSEAFKQLCRALQQDPYTIYEVVIACEAYMVMDDDAISKTVSCFISRYETSIDKAYRRLQFNSEEQKYLYTANVQIGRFLQSLCPERVKKSRQERFKSMDKECQCVKEQMEQKSEDVSLTTIQAVEVKIETDHPIEQTKVVDSPSPMYIIQMQEKILEFYKLYDELEISEYLLKNRNKVEEFFRVLRKFN